MDKWDKFAEDLSRVDNINNFSAISFWKARLQEESGLYERKIKFLHEEIALLKEMLDRYSTDVKMTHQRLIETERRFDYERNVLEERLRTKDAELKLEQSRADNAVKEARMVQPPMQGYIPPVSGAVQPGPGPEQAVLRQQMASLQEQAAAARVLEEEVSALKKELAEQKADKQHAPIEERIKLYLAREEAHLLDLENLARGFAHKVRNYLGIISGTAQMVIARSKISDEVKEQINVIEDNARQMLESIEEFLSLAKIPELNLVPSSVNDLVNTVSLAIEDTLKTNSIDVAKKLGANIPQVPMETRLIGEALENMINNAAESMKNGGTVTVETGILPEKEMIFIKIIDKGKGISDNHMKKVYQPYFSTKKGHKGLGLTLCRRVAELHHGLLDLETEKNEGSTVTLYLPLMQDAIKK